MMSVLMLSYAKIRMKVKTFESRVFEMEYSSLKTEY